MPAAGAARRMGRDKLLIALDGAPVARRNLMRLRAAGLDVVVTLPPGAPARAQALSGRGARLLRLTDAAEGMAASIRAGARAARQARAAGLLILPADLTAVQVTAIRRACRIWRHRPDRALRAVSPTGAPGHPVILPARFFPALMRLAGDRGARGLLGVRGLTRLRLPGGEASADLDTPADLPRPRPRPHR